MAVSLHCSTKESTVKINKVNISKLYIKDVALATSFRKCTAVFTKRLGASLTNHNVPRGPLKEENVCCQLLPALLDFGYNLTYCNFNFS